MNIRIGLIIASLVTVVSMSTQAASNVGANKLIKEATSAYKQVAKDTSYQWTTSVKAIKAAQKAYDAGNFTSAEKLARQALDLVDATSIQAKIEAKTWQMRVPK